MKDYKNPGDLSRYIFHVSYQVKEFFNWSETKFNNKTKNERTIKMDTSLESQISGLSFYVLFTLKLELLAQIKFYPA